MYRTEKGNKKTSGLFLCGLGLDFQNLLAFVKAAVGADFVRSNRIIAVFTN